jgi:prepilin-type N-terminal cleavage/methylation domain-containing protein
MQIRCKSKIINFVFSVQLLIANAKWLAQAPTVTGDQNEKWLRARRGFTLVETLVVIALIAGLVTLGIFGMRGALTASKQAASSSNLRNIGLALQLYADDNQGKYPETTHSVGLGNAWIYSLERYMGMFDETRICPADPHKKERLAAKGSSYILNSYIFVPRTGPFGKVIGPQLNRPAVIPEPERTILVFICSDRTGVGPGNDHTHSNLWKSWNSVIADIAPDRFGGDGKHRDKGRSLYLHADGSVAAFAASEMKRKTESGINIAMPPGVAELE